MSHSIETKTLYKRKDISSLKSENHKKDYYNEFHNYMDFQI